MTTPEPKTAGHNRLIHSTSPYLLQHAHNPVDWHPWDQTALEKARAEDKPVFLSIGYSACHWCHVMERESFENPAVAALLNRHFVSIKVDREERPDIDEIYMAAVTAMTGGGGWPMSVFLTPDLKPFYGGTYFPPEDHYNRPGFRRLLEALAEMWQNRREELLSGAADMAANLRTRFESPTPGDGEPPPGASLTEAAAQELAREYDPVDGGWGGAPKFPSSGAVELLLRHHHRTGNTKSLEMALRTLDCMADGGLHDHIGGGFHRYSVDNAWLVPHFEKMLYDNAQLARAFLEAWLAAGHARHRHAAEDTLDYLLRDMQLPEGGFCASEDADSAGGEGMFYLWTRAEIMDVLGPEAGVLFCAAYNIETAGNFPSHEHYHDRQNIPHRTEPPGELSRRLGVDADMMEKRLSAARAVLLETRARRPRPGRDDKVVAAWNGLAVSALAHAGLALNTPRYLDAAEACANFLLTHAVRGGALHRTWRGGQCGPPGFLEDYAAVAHACLDLFEATGKIIWLEESLRLAEAMTGEFSDPAGPAFFMTSARHDTLPARAKPCYDGVEPSGNTLAASLLLKLGAVTDREEWQKRGEAILRGQATMMGRVPQAFLKMLCVADGLQECAVEVVVVPGEEGNPEQFLGAASGVFLPHRMLAVHPGETHPLARAPLFSDRVAVDGRTAAYVCRGNTCLPPVTSPEALREILRGNRG